jgi:hypothetical protein
VWLGDPPSGVRGILGGRRTEERPSLLMSHSFGRFLLGLQDRRLPLPRQILEAAGLKQRLVELAPLKVVGYPPLSEMSELHVRARFVPMASAELSRRVHGERRPLASWLDLSLGLSAGLNLDRTRLRPLRYWEREREHAALVARADVVDVNCRAESQVTVEAALRPLIDDDLVFIFLFEPPFGADGKHSGLDRDIDRAGIDTWKVEVNDELLAAAVGIHRKAARNSSTGDELLHELLVLTKRVVPECHLSSSHASCSSPVAIDSTGTIRLRSSKRFEDRRHVVRPGQRRSRHWQSLGRIGIPGGDVEPQVGLLPC